MGSETHLALLQLLSVSAWKRRLCRVCGALQHCVGSIPLLSEIAAFRNMEKIGGIRELLLPRTNKFIEREIAVVAHNMNREKQTTTAAAAAAVAAASPIPAQKQSFLYELTFFLEREKK